MKLQPTRGIILIKADPVKEKTASGLYIKEEWKTIPPFGTVEAVGLGVEVVKPGDRVLFERYASIILEDDYRLCEEDHILAIVKDEHVPA